MELEYTVLKIGNWYLSMSQYMLDSQGALVENKQEAYRTSSMPDMPSCFVYDASGHVREHFVIDASWKKCYEEQHDNYMLSFYKTALKTYIMLEQEANSLEVQYALELTEDFTDCKLLYDITESNGQLVFERLIIPFSYAIMAQGGFVLHGVLMEYRGYGIIVTAPSGTGKSTHAHIWRDQENALIINGDRVLLKRDGDRMMGYGMPWCGSSGEYVNRQVPVAVVVILSQGEENKVSRANTVEAYMAILEELGAPRWESGLYEKGIGYIDEMLSVLPVLQLSCRPDKEAMEILKKEVDRIIQEKDCLL